MREGAPAVAVAERPDPGDVRAELVVDRDVAARVDRDAGRVEPQVVGVRAAPDGEQQVRPVDRRRALLAVDADATPVGRLLESDALGAGAHGDALALEDLADRRPRRPRPRAR